MAQSPQILNKNKKNNCYCYHAAWCLALPIEGEMEGVCSVLSV